MDLTLSASDLVLVDALVEAGSVTGAARRLGSSQPAVSRSLRQIEHRIGEPLFDRLPRGLAPTALGATLAAHGRTVAATTDRAADVLDAALAGNAATIRLGVVPHLSIVHVATAVERFVSSGTTITLETADTDPLLRALHDGTIDCYLGPLPSAGAGLAFEANPLFEDAPLIIAAADHPLTKRTPTVADLTNYPWIVPRDGLPIVDQWRSLFLDHDLEPPTPSIVTTDLAFAAAIAAQSSHLAVLPRAAATIALGPGFLTALDLRPPGRGATIGALWRRHAPQRALVQTFIALLREELDRAGVEPRVEGDGALSART